jgi:hypothetical protein
MTTSIFTHSSPSSSGVASASSWSSSSTSWVEVVLGSILGILRRWFKKPSWESVEATSSDRRWHALARSASVREIEYCPFVPFNFDTSTSLIVMVVGMLRLTILIDRLARLEGVSGVIVGGAYGGASASACRQKRRMIEIQ